MKLKIDTTFLKKLGLGTGSVVSQVAYFLSTKVVRITLVSVAVMIIGYLGYQKVWLPLQEKAVLPPEAVGPTAVDANILQTINAQRADRAQHIPHDFSNEARQIVPKSATDTVAQ